MFNMDMILDFNDLFFGDLNEYKRLIISLLESLKLVTPTTYWTLDTDSTKGLSAIIIMEILDLIFNSLDKVADNMYSNDMVTQEFPIFLEIKEIIECLLNEPIYESDEYINLAISIFSDFFTLIEAKLLLFDGCSIELEASQEVLDEYDKEFENYIERFERDKSEFLSLLF